MFDTFVSSAMFRSSSFMIVVCLCDSSLVWVVLVLYVVLLLVFVVQVVVNPLQCCFVVECKMLFRR